ncbi:hypothetical protein ABBQ38_010909 [Trebouxia sp. C0009 RCD-2024]
MVKELAKLSAVPEQKPLVGAVYKRQRKQQTGLSRNIGLPQRTTSRLSATSAATRLTTTKSSHKSGPKRLHALHKSIERVACKSSRIALQPLQPAAHSSSQSHQDIQGNPGQPGPSWGLTQEAQYFAKLDTEELIEDGQEAAEAPLRTQQAEATQTQQTAASQSQGRKPKLKCMEVECSSHVQTPDAVALAKYHPDLQAEYTEYVRCIGASQSALTPMLLEDFCRLVGKEARGLPVFNT